MKEAYVTASDVTITEAGTPADRPLLEIRDLAITFNTSNGDVNRSCWTAKTSRTRRKSG
jgi:hypothetical protein